MSILVSEKFLSENNDETWKAKTESDLSAEREEARELEMEFKDIPNLTE